MWSVAADIVGGMRSVWEDRFLGYEVHSVVADIPSPLLGIWYQHGPQGHARMQILQCGSHATK